MWDLKNTVNQCVKCESKFTTPEKPLKLLPCLHSMCLDCLCGSLPASSPVRAVGELSTTNKKDVHNKYDNEQGVDLLQNKNNLNDVLNNFDPDANCKEKTNITDGTENCFNNIIDDEEKDKQLASVSKCSLLDIDHNESGFSVNESDASTQPTETESVGLGLNRKDNGSTELENVKSTPITALIWEKMDIYRSCFYTKHSIEVKQVEESKKDLIETLQGTLEQEETLAGWGDIYKMYKMAQNRFD